MDIFTLRACLAEIEGAHGADGSGFEIQVLLQGGHTLRGPYGWQETERADVLPRFIFLVQGHGSACETFSIPISSIVAVGGVS